MKVLLKTPDLVAEKIILGSISEIGNVGYISKSFKNYWSSGIEDQVKKRMTSSSEEIRYYGDGSLDNAGINNTGRKHLKKVLLEMFRNGEKIVFSPYETISGDENIISIEKCGNYSLIQYSGRRHALFADNNCLGGNFFKNSSTEDFEREFQVVEIQTQDTGRKWYEF